MMTSEELLKCKKSVETAKSNYDRACGQLEAAKKSIVEKGFKGMPELNAEIAKLTEQTQTEEAAITQEENLWKETHKDLLQG
jgi:hypothetical protein